MYTVLADRALRASAGSASEVVGYAMAGQEIEDLHQIKDYRGAIWCKVKCGDTIGWINDTFLYER